MSGTGKSTLAKELKNALEEKYQCKIIAHPSKNNFYGNLSRKLIQWKNKVKIDFITQIIDLFIGLLAIKDFKNSLSLTKENPEFIYIWERSPLSTLVYNCSTPLIAQILVPKIVALAFPPETKWIMLVDINYKQLVQRLQNRNRDEQDLQANRAELITQTTRFIAYISLLMNKAFFKQFNSVNTSLLWDSPINNKINDILTFIKMKDTYLFF